MNKIHVQAAPDRHVHISAVDHVNGGAVMLASPGDTCAEPCHHKHEAIEVQESTTIRRRIRAGDLVQMKGERSTATPEKSEPAKVTNEAKQSGPAGEPSTTKSK